MVEHLPYGSWPSPIGVELLVAGAARPSDVQAGGGVTWWSEARPSEGSREQIVRCDPDGTTVDVLPAGWGARTRVHEYGGAAWWVDAEGGSGDAADGGAQGGAEEGRGTVYFVNFADQRLYRIAPGRPDPVPLSPEPPTPHALRYADGVLTPDRRWVVAVQERHEPSGEGADGG